MTAREKPPGARTDEESTTSTTPLPFGFTTEWTGVIFSTWAPHELLPEQRDVTPADLRALGWVPREELTDALRHMTEARAGWARAHRKHVLPAGGVLERKDGDHYIYRLPTGRTLIVPMGGSQSEIASYLPSKLRRLLRATDARKDSR